MNKFGVREAVEMFEMLRDSACMIDHFTDYIQHSQDPALRQILESQQRKMVEEYQHKANVMQGHGLDMSNLPRFQSAASTHQGPSASAMAGLQSAGGMAGLQGASGTSGMHGQHHTQFGLQQPGQVQHAQQMQYAQQGQHQPAQLHQTTQQHQHTQQVQQSSARTLNDRTIAQGALFFHKCSSLRSTMAALESAEPHLRNLAANSSRICMDMAYEIFRYMEQRGFYQLPELPSNFVNHMQGAGTQGYQQMHQNYQGLQQNLPAGGGMSSQYS